LITCARLLISAALLLLACAATVPHLPSRTRYPVSATRRTPAGVAVDDPRAELPDATVDEAFAAVESCLAAKPRTMTAGDTAMWGGMNCSTSRIPATVNRAHLVVKVAPDWHVSACSGQQLFPCQIDSSGCLAKGVQPTPECPCQCRHAVQEHAGVYTLIVTPDALLLRAAIVEAVTGCENPWAGLLAECTR
jgi:hypothetical protein